MTIRFRSRGGFSAFPPAQEYQIHTTCYQTDWVPTGNNGTYTLRGGVYERMTDYVIEGFRRKRAAGELFFNNMWYERLDAFGSGNGYYVKGKWNTCTNPAWPVEYDGQGNWSGRFIKTAMYENTALPALETIVDQGTLRDLESQVSTEMLSNRGRSDTNLFESLAEIDQTIGLFDKPISRLASTLKKAKRAKEKGEFIGYSVNGVSNLWLAYRYGIVPLLNDIQGVIDGLSAQTALRRSTTRAKKGFETSDTRSYNSTLGLLQMTVTNKITESHTVRVMSLDEFNTSLMENIGFTSKNLITLPWELVNLSFVADWFVNIGDYLGAITPAFGWKNLGSCMTHITGVTNRYTVHSGVNLIPANYTVSRYPTGSYDLSLLRKVRSPVRFPDLVIKNDFRFDKPKRVADALSLLAQRLVGTFGGDLYSGASRRRYDPLRDIAFRFPGP